jgi:hypothetical protein
MAKISINISLAANSNANNIASAARVNLSNTSGARGYFNLLDLQNNAGVGVSAGSGSDWSSSWKQQQMANERRNSPRQDHSDPSPLLVDIISSLPLNSSRRRSYENLKLTLDGTSSNVGYGLDSMTRESYRDLRRLSKQSNMIHSGMMQPLPDASNLLGSEEGQYVSNLQDWRPAFANAGKPVSDAMGSHSDMEHSITKDAAGPAAFIPSACASLIDNVNPHFTNEIEGSFKRNQMEFLQHLPSKIAGNLRHLSTALDSVLSIPFEIASDVYNGLRQLMSQISDLLDGLKSKIFGFLLSSIGGLVDGLFPEGMLDGIVSAISSIANEFGDLFDMLGGFSVISSIRDIMSNIISGNFLSALGNIANLGKMLMSGFGAGGLLGGLAGAAIDCLEGQLGLGQSSALSKGLGKGLTTGIAIGGILGSLPSIGQGLGNLGSIIGNGISSLVGSVVSNIRNLGGIIAGILPMGLGFIMNKLMGKLCGVGMTGNKGYSVGGTFDNHRNRTFDRCMNSHSTHSSILGPLFNKQTTIKGSYATESSLTLFEDSSFVRGAQGTKGVTMVGPGGSAFYKPFGLSQGGYGSYSTTSSGRGNPVRSYSSPGNLSLAQQAASLNLSIRGLPGIGGMQTNVNFGIALPSF